MTGISDKVFFKRKKKRKGKEKKAGGATRTENFFPVHNKGELWLLKLQLVYKK
jgi:hypothetical protein